MLNHPICFLLAIFLFFIIPRAWATVDVLQSLILLSSSELNQINANQSVKQRRSNLSEPINGLTLEAEPFLGENPKISSTFEASFAPPIPTSQSFESKLIEFANEGDIDIDHFEEDLQSLVTQKNRLSLSNGAFISALKSLLVVSISKSDVDPEKLSKTLLTNIIPNISEWGDSGPSWIKSISQVFVESYTEANRLNELPFATKSFASNIVSLIASPENFLGTPLDTNIGIYILGNDSANDGNYEPESTDLIQQFVVGITQGVFSKYTEENLDSPSINDLDLLTGADEVAGDFLLNEGSLKPSLVGSIINGLMSSPEFNEREDLLYDALKAASNGFLIASTVATTSSEYFSNNEMPLQIAEKIAKNTTQYALLHRPDGSDRFSIANLKVDRISESIALGSAMGSQLATVLPKSMDYTHSWERQTNIRRELAKAVARGNASGTTESTSWLSTVIDEETNEQVISINQIEDAARGSSLGSMMGNTGLAVYYPTKQMVPIINFTAQGSALGTTNSQNLQYVETTKTEGIEVSIARQSAVGSSLGASFEPTVLLGLRPDIRSRDSQTIDHLAAASFGSTYGALLGIELNKNIPSQANDNLGDADTIKIEIKQASKQGSVEGALAGAKLAMGVDDLTTENLKSKTEILKAITKSNANAGATSNNNAVVNFETNPQDMLLLMSKFGINPRFTNSSKMYKRPVVSQTDETPIDENAEASIKNASPI